MTDQAPETATETQIEAVNTAGDPQDDVAAAEEEPQAPTEQTEGELGDI